MTEVLVLPGPAGPVERTRFGYLTDDHPRLDRVQNALSAVSGVIAVVAVIAILVLTLAGVVGRAVFEAPLGWSVSLIRTYLLAALAFFGAVTAYRTGAHVAVTSIFERFAPRAQKILLVIAYSVVIAGFAALFIAGTAASVFALETGMWPFPGPSELMIPTWLYEAIVPVASLFGMVVVGIDLCRELFSPWDRPHTDYETRVRVDASGAGKEHA